jgi:hypothetical protein
MGGSVLQRPPVVGNRAAGFPLIPTEPGGGNRHAARNFTFFAKSVLPRTTPALLSPSRQKRALRWTETVGAEVRNLFKKKLRKRVDGFANSAIFEIPPETGLPQAKADGAGSSIFWDCKLRLNFVPALMNGNVILSRKTELGFFVA